MKTLVIETSSEKSFLACVEEGQIVAMHPLPPGPALSKCLALEVSLLLEKLSFFPHRIGVGKGPGSFTGTRVGMALAKALAFGWNIPLFEFCSLKLFAPTISHTFAVVCDARSSGVYVWTPDREDAALYPLEEAKTVLAQVPYLASSHPTLLQQKLSLSGTWIETSPNLSLI